MSEDRIADGPHRDFESLAMPLLDPLFRAAMNLAGNEHDARDLVQTTYLKAMESYGGFRPGSNIKAWMMRIMRNTWIDRLRHLKAAGNELPLEEEWLPAADDAQDVPENPAADIMERFSDAQVITALRELGEEQRTALFLSDVEGMGQDDIAEVMGVAVGTIKSRVSRARSLLRKRLEDHARKLGFMEKRQWRT